MAVTPGKNAKFFLDNAAGSLQDLSTFTTSVEFTPDVQIHDTSVFGVGSRSKITGIKDAKFTATFFNDPTVQTHIIGLYGLASGVTSSFEYGPQGNTTGMQRIKGECILASWPISANVNDVESIPCGFEVTGAVTFDTF